eukprot:TRINITY_DN184_c1_g1_i19.p2 TRINITY_DN184_c1_g1~~TRINITY_DN184_c1_g1_i19.p2  ORF type:complete len:110 (+),score=17.68 TRINITY_DN184_c1_g1_i19:98-427(+)
MVKIVNGEVLQDDEDVPRSPYVPSTKSMSLRVGSFEIHPLYLLIPGLVFWRMFGTRGLVLFAVLVAILKGIQIQADSRRPSSSGGATTGNGRPPPTIKTIKDYPKPKGG